MVFTAATGAEPTEGVPWIPVREPRIERNVVTGTAKAVMKSWWVLLKGAAANWATHKDARQGAALAYYSVFSIGPLMVIAIAIAGLVFGRDAVGGQVALSIRDMLGETGAKAVQAMLVDASRPQAGLLAT